MKRAPDWWPWVMAIFVSTSLSAATPAPTVATPTPSAKITSAVLDDLPNGEVVGTIKYVVRAPRGANVTIDQAWISGEAIPIPPTADTRDRATDVGTVVLIDAGTPGKPELSSKVFEWTRALATGRPDWQYRFITGDQHRCFVSKDLAKDSKDRLVYQNYQKLLTLAPSDALALNPPVAEQMQEMVDLFSADAHTLVVIAPQAPMWLPREVTEWMTRDDHPLTTEDRRRRGLREQFRVRAGDADAIHEIAEWIRLGHLRVVILPEGSASSSTQQIASKQTNVAKAPAPPAPSASDRWWAPLRNGVDDALIGLSAPASAAELIKETTPLLTESRGTVTVPIDDLQRLGSGAYTSKLEVLIDPDNKLKPSSMWTIETTMSERALKTGRLRYCASFRPIFRELRSHLFCLFSFWISQAVAENILPRTS